MDLSFINEWKIAQLKKCLRLAAQNGPKIRTTGNLSEMRATLRQFLDAHPEMIDDVKRLNSIETEASHDEPFLPIFLRRRPLHPITAECLELLAVSFDQKYVQETSEDVSSLDEALQQAKELVKIMVRSKTAMGELGQPGLAENFHVWSTTIRESFSSTPKIRMEIVMLYEVFGVDFEVENSSPATNHDLNQQVTVIIDGMNRSILEFHATVLPPLRPFFPEDFDEEDRRLLRRFITEYIMDPENSIDPNNMTDKLRDKAALELETRDDFSVEKGRDIIIISQVLKQKLAEMRTGAQRAEEKKRRRGEILVTTAESSDDEEYRPDLSTAGVTKKPRQRLVISDSENET